MLFVVGMFKVKKITKIRPINKHNQRIHIRVSFQEALPTKNSK